MSYCRFSSNDYQCDVYVFADCMGGYTTHVAAMRVAFKSPLPPAVTECANNLDKWLDRYNTVSDMLRVADHVPIGLPHDGDSFRDDTPGECADRLEGLRAMGYRVPQYAIDALRAEQEG